MEKVMITPEGLRRMRETGSYKRGDFHQAMLDVAYEEWQANERSILHQIYKREDGQKIVMFEGTADEIDERYSKMDLLQVNEERAETSVCKKKGQKEWGYDDMLAYARETFGEMFYIMTLVGKYNQQVGNGGHVQYFDNGYASSGGGFGDEHDPSLPNHREMVQLYSKIIMPMIGGLSESQAAEMTAALAIMKQLRIRIDTERETTCDCDECDGSGWVEHTDPETGDDLDSTRCETCAGSGQVECDNDEYGTVINGDFLEKLDAAWYKLKEFEEACVEIVNIALIAAGDTDCVLIKYGAYQFKKYYDMVFVNRFSYMPLSKRILEGVGAECYDLLVSDNIKYQYIEPVEDDEDSSGYRRHPVNYMTCELNKKIRSMQVGDTLDYTADVVIKYMSRPDVIAAYEVMLASEVKYGRLKELSVHDGVISGYEKLKM